MDESDAFEPYDLRVAYEAERDRAGPHGRIMRYDLNRNG